MQDFDIVSGIATTIVPSHSGSKVLLADGTRVYYSTVLDSQLAGAKLSFKGKWGESGHGRYFLAEELGFASSTQKFSKTKGTRPTNALLEGIFPLPIIEMASSQRGLVKKLTSMDRTQLLSILTNPWLLYIRRCAQFSFCDLLADSLNIPRSIEQRLPAAVLYVLNEAYKKGPYPVETQLMASELTSLGVSAGSLPDISIPAVVRDENGHFHLSKIWKARSDVMGLVRNNQMSLFKPECKSPSVAALLSTRYSILTGKPGTGKTTLLRYIKELPLFTINTAMTGKAAQVLGGETIHKVLGFGPRGFTIRRLDCDMLLVDEASMLDWITARAIFRAARGHVILCGDPAQLPPVGGENVFNILTTVLPVVELTVQHRFSNGEAKVNKILCRSQKECLTSLHNVISAFTSRNITNYQVLAPVKCGMGTYHINLDLQKYMNPGGSPIADTNFRAGDKVIVTKNCYDKAVAVSNGQLGVIVKQQDQQILVRLDHCGVVEAFRPSEIDLAYCLTVHKAQGSQWDFVILIVADPDSDFVSQELLYTATTRAKKLTYTITLTTPGAVAVS